MTSTAPKMTKKLKDRAQDYPGVWQWIKISNPKGTDPEALHDELERKIDDLDRGYSETMEYFAEFRKAQRKEKKRAEKVLRKAFQWPRPGWDWLEGDLVHHQYNELYGVVKKVTANGRVLTVAAVGDSDLQAWDAGDCKLVRRG